MTRLHHLQIQECTNCGANYRIALSRCPRCKTPAGIEEPAQAKRKPTRAKESAHTGDTTESFIQSTIVFADETRSTD